MQSPRIVLREGACVAELIDRDTKKWNMNLISAIFFEEEAKAILNIPLSPFQPKDRLIWWGTKNGEFSVRRAYHIAMETIVSNRSGGSGTCKDSGIWKGVLETSCAQCG